MMQEGIGKTQNNNENIDRQYAEACQTVLNETKKLSPWEISQKFDALNTKYYPEFEGPRSLMLREVWGEILWGKLDPVEARAMRNDPEETLDEIKIIIRDYLAGNFYPTYFLLTISYRNNDTGYSCLACVRNSQLVVEAALVEIQKEVEKAVSKIEVSNNEKQDLLKLESYLPRAIDDFSLDSTEIQEILA